MELVTVKSVCSRVDALTSWQSRGGVMIMSYELYRILTHGDQAKYSKQQENLRTALQDPGMKLPNPTHLFTLYCMTHPAKSCSLFTIFCTRMVPNPAPYSLSSELTSCQILLPIH